MIVFSLFEAKSLHRKSCDTLCTENKEKKSLNFAHRTLHFVTSKPNTISEFQGKKMSWKPKKRSLQKPTVVVFSFQVRQRELFFSFWGKQKRKIKSRNLLMFFLFKQNRWKCFCFLKQEQTNWSAVLEKYRKSSS